MNTVYTRSVRSSSLVVQYSIVRYVRSGAMENKYKARASNTVYKLLSVQLEWMMDAVVLFVLRIIQYTISEEHNTQCVRDGTNLVSVRKFVGVCNGCFTTVCR